MSSVVVEQQEREMAEYGSEETKSIHLIMSVKFCWKKQL